LCRLLKVARSSFYAWMAGEQARAVRRAADDALAHEITVLHIASRCTYGVPRIHAELRRLDRRVNRKRVERIMRERDITGVTRRKRRSLTRRRRELLRAAESGDRHPPPARPDYRPRRDLHLHRDLLQPQAAAEASSLGLAHPAGDPAATRARTRPRSVSIECPASRGNFSAAQRFLSAFSGISPHFRPRRHLMNATEHRTEMINRFAIWDQITGAAGQPATA
jgi:hypothetical protein